MKWLIYILGCMVAVGLGIAKMPPFHQDGAFICFLILLISILKLHPKPAFAESPKGSWVGYLKGIAFFLPPNVFLPFGLTYP